MLDVAVIFLAAGIGVFSSRLYVDGLRTVKGLGP